MKTTLPSPFVVLFALSVCCPFYSYSEVTEVEWIEEETTDEDLFALFEEQLEELALQPETEEPVVLKEEKLTLRAPATQPLNTSLFADTEITVSSSPADLMMRDHNSFLSIGGSYTYVHLKPDDNLSFHGNLAGAQGLYEYRPAAGFYGAIKAAWRQGETKAGTTSRFLVDVDAEERIGFTVNGYDKKWLWTLFSGLGFRYLNQHLKQSGVAPVRFIYNEFYCPLGIFTDYAIFPWFSWGIHATWMPQVFPTVSISPIKGSRWKTTSMIGNALIEMPFVFFAGEKKHFFASFVPHFEYWQDGHTTAVTSTGEALGLRGNTYFFWGADLNLGCAF